MALRLMVLAAFLLASGAPSAAQSAGAQATFRSGVDLVRFDVRIVDAAGRPITDLRQDEIDIAESGTPLPVVLFQRVTEPAGSYVDAALRAVTAEVSSNEAFPRGHLYILIFDQQHITPGNEQRARVAAEQFIRRRVRPSDRVALFAVPGPGPQLRFTADTTRAISELSSIRGSYQRIAPTPYGNLPIYDAHRIVAGDAVLMEKTLERLAAEGGGDLLGVSGAAEEEGAVVRRLLQENARAVVNKTDAESRQFLQRLADLIAEFREIEGRKTVVLFSEGFFQDNLARELETVAASAAQSYAVFHTFDLNPRGLSPAETSVTDTTLASEIHARIAPLATLAVETDGMMVIDASARSGQALNAIADQAQDYYLVGFTPSEQARLNRGQYRRVTIRVTRPGARVSARTGYALKPEPSAVDRRRAINTVLGAPFVQQGIRIDYTTYVMKAAEGGHRVVLSLDADLPVRAAPGDTADVVFVVRDARDGRVAASGTDTIPLPATTRTGESAGAGSWRVQFTVPAGSYLMRAVVREPGGLVGSADRRLDVRALDGPDLTASDLVLGSPAGGLLVKPRAYTGDGLSGVIEMYGRTQVQFEGLGVSIELRRQSDGATIDRQSADLQQPEDAPGGISRRATFLLPLAAVPPGAYLTHAVVTARGEIVAERTRQVDIVEGTAPATSPVATLGAERVSPADVVRGDLGRKYSAALAARAAGTPAHRAARRAAEGRWEEVELLLGRPAGPPTFVSHALRGLALFVREQHAEAAAAFAQALAAEPGSAVTAFFLGWAHEGAGDARAALSAWRAAAHLDPTLVSAHLALADGYLRLSQPALALQALRAGLVALPASPELRAKVDQIEQIR